MTFEAQTASRMMSLQFLQIHEATTVSEAIARLRAGTPAEEIFVLCAVDDAGRLIGVVPIERLIFSDAATTLRQVATRHVVSVMPETSQDEVARIALRHRVWCVAVVDREGRPMGTIKVGDILQSIREGGGKKRSLCRRLTRLVRARPVSRPAPEASYRLEASYVDSDAAYVRTVLVRSLDPEKIRLASFESKKVGSTAGVRVCAELIAIARNDRWIEQVAWRLSLEPGLKALGWQFVSQGGKK
jgi:CBS domain-containing protein